MTNEYTENKLKEIEQNILSGYEKDRLQEKEIEEASLSIAARIISKKHADEIFMNTQYKFAIVENTQGRNTETGEIENGVLVLCYDMIKVKIVGVEKYTPLTAFHRYIKDMDYTNFIASIVKSILWHKAGLDVNNIEESEDL